MLRLIFTYMDTGEPIAELLRVARGEWLRTQDDRASIMHLCISSRECGLFALMNARPIEA